MSQDKYAKQLNKKQDKNAKTRTREFEIMEHKKENTLIKNEKDRNKNEKNAGKIEAKEIMNIEKRKSGDIVGKNKPGTIIECKGLNKKYTNGIVSFHALKDVDLEINTGEVVVILGPSGSGKTTLLNMISGLDVTTTGEVIVADEIISNMRDRQLNTFRRMHVGFVFQQYNLLPNLNAKENAEIGSYLQKDPERKINIDTILEKIDLLPFANKYPHELSGGQQQRVSIARAIAKNPGVLFADEPTGALDEVTGRKVLQTLLEINAEYKTTLVMVTHSTDIARLADKVIRVANGKIAEVKINKARAAISDINW